MSTARRYLPQYTVSDYQTWEGDWELWQGIPVSMSPGPFGRHQKVVRNLMIALIAEVQNRGCEAEIVHELDWIISDDTVVRPDLVLICGPAPDDYLREPPALVAEVLSDATRDRDQTAKRDLYDEQGVAVYLLLDPDAQSLELYTRSHDGNMHVATVDDKIQLSICDDCQLTLQRSKLF